MTDIQLLEDVTVKVIDVMGTDDSVIQAAQVSVTGENEVGMTDERRAGLINYLMKSRHGSPFEQAELKFYVSGPIFAFREFQRHRIANYNERSGRYSKLEPNFYVPAANRPLVNIGSSAHPVMGPADDDVVAAVRETLDEAYNDAWDYYQSLLKLGIAKEVARVVLPLGIFSEMYAKMNLRGWMNFLSLRTYEADAAYPSRPQHEIEMIARKIEAEFAERFPLVYAAWNANGRVAP